jgi:ketosteroid isomerase-like protein
VSDEEEVRAILERFRRGWETLDAEMTLACFAQGPGTLVIGTDANEYWRGFDAFATPFRTMAGAFESAQYRWAAEPVVATAGDHAWADGVLDTSLVAGGEPVAARLRTTWVLRRGPEGWRVVQAHFSVAPLQPVAAY